MTSDSIDRKRPATKGPVDHEPANKVRILHCRDTRLNCQTQSRESDSVSETETESCQLTRSQTQKKTSNCEGGLCKYALPVGNLQIRFHSQLSGSLSDPLPHSLCANCQDRSPRLLHKCKAPVNGSNKLFTVFPRNDHCLKAASGSSYSSSEVCRDCFEFEISNKIRLKPDSSNRSKHKQIGNSSAEDFLPFTSSKTCATPKCSLGRKRKFCDIEEPSQITNFKAARLKPSLYPHKVPSSSNTTIEQMADHYNNFQYWRQCLPDIEDELRELSSESMVTESDSIEEESPQFNNFNYWRSPLADIDLSEISLC